MRTAIVVLLMSVATLCCAADKERGENQATKRLGSVTWDLVSHRLEWVVQNGVTRDGQFVPTGETRYQISPDDAVMVYERERRGFTREEAAALHRLLDTLSRYCAESVMWWDQGQGDRLDPEPSAPGEKLRVEERRTPPPAPPLPGEKVARLQIQVKR